MAVYEFHYDVVTDGEQIDMGGNAAIIDTVAIEPGTLGVWWRKSVPEPLPDSMQETDNLEI